jgi:UDP-N-acetylmuramoyl-tripeptide--D-alanyl-D-alanine ligase
MSASFTPDEIRTALGPELVSEIPGGAAFFHSITNDSRLAQPGQLFVALRTEDRDGHAFIPDALSKNVAGMLIEASNALAKEALASRMQEETLAGRIQEEGLATRTRPEALVGRGDSVSPASESAKAGSPTAPWVFQVPDTTHALGQLASYHRQRFLHLRTVTITGNTGKTSTKELTAAILERQYHVLKSPANFNNEVGLSMTLLEANEAHERAVLETGMDRLGEIARLCEIARPDTAVVLNVGPTHLEKLGSMEAIAQAKGEAVEAIGEFGTAVLNADDPYVAAMASKCKGRVLTFGLQPGAFVRASDVRTKGLNGVDFQLSCGGRSVAAHSPLPGERLVYNALAAVAVGVAEGMSVEDAAFALGRAEVPARLQAKLSPTGATILDDCYNASPASTTAALSVLGEMLGGRRLALLGDMLELGSAEAEGHAQVGEYAAQVVDGLFTVGRLGALIAASARASGNRFVRHFDTTDEAIAELRDLLEPGDVLLIKASHGMHLENVVAALMAPTSSGAAPA